MKLRRLLHALLPLVVVTATCGRGSTRAARGPGMVEELHRDHQSELSEPAQWIVRSPAEWDRMRQRIGPRSARMNATVRPDFASNMLVVAAAGDGSSGDPLVEFQGYRDTGRTRHVFVRYSAGCDAAQDITRAYVVGRMPTWEGEVKVVARWESPDC